MRQSHCPVFSFSSHCDRSKIEINKIKLDYLQSHSQLLSTEMLYVLIAILSLVRVWPHLVFSFKNAPELLMCLEYLKQNTILFKHLNRQSTVMQIN